MYKTFMVRSRYVMVTNTEKGPRYTWDDGRFLSTKRFTKMLLDGAFIPQTLDNLFGDTPQVFWLKEE